VDDGAGMQPGHRSGMGLANARRRLRELYGEEQSLEVQAAGGGGVAATVSIPFHDAPGGAQSECAAPLSEQLPRYGGTLGM